jgi:DNA-binding HxlR family transcriptional regulator
MDAAIRADAVESRGRCARLPADQVEFIRQIADRIGDKWSLPVIGMLEPGPLRYTDLQQELPGISQRMLTRTLGQLQENALITRKSFPEVPPRVEYSLTPLGRGLNEIAASLIGWASDHLDEIREHRDRTVGKAPETGMESPRQDRQRVPAEDSMSIG